MAHKAIWPFLKTCQPLGWRMISPKVIYRSVEWPRANMWSGKNKITKKRSILRIGIIPGTIDGH